ncbi:zinc finger protein 28-like [Mercenaria mercenaria]|uniref:zinc finger protein 28-like n=1 Tax=Mercenaria mercenaria TaxID=6596 RepID=UPI00234E453C|nr:zinc finger protein 28-like [Mercenaria mercenaria]
MAFLLEAQEQKIEYVYPFICGLCGFGSSNIDIFHHHFETHGELVPSSVFHLCELENTRDDEAESELNIGSYCCKTCNHTFPTVCHLQKHLDEDSSSDKYIMDLQTKTAYPLTSQCASVLSHSFLSESNLWKDQINPIDKSLSGKWSSNTKNTRNASPKKNVKYVRARSSGGKSGPKQTPEKRLDLHSFQELLHEAQLNQKAANNVYSTIEDIDYSNDYDDDDDDDDDDDNSNVVSLIQEVTVGQHTSKKSKTKKTSKHTREPRTKLGEWINCKYCGLSFRKQTQRSEHEEEHKTVEGNLKYAAEKLCTCEKCGCVMLKLKLHLHACLFSKRIRRPRAKDGEPKKTRDVTITPCPYCDKKVKKYFLSHHIKEVHQEHEPVPCEICGKIFRHKYALYKHGILHKGEKRFPCSKCGKRFYTRSKLKNHMIMHGNARNYQCELCPANYKYLRNLRFHKERVHSEKAEAIFLCELCPKYYNYKDGLGQHMRRVHNIWATPEDPDNPRKAPEKSKEIYNCDICAKVLHTKKGLTNHLKNHKIPEGEKLPFLCDECPQRYSSKLGLKRHKERQHTATDFIKEYKCEHCPKVFTSPDSLRMHKNRNHKPGDNWLLCGWKACRHRFKEQSELEEHRKCHKDTVEFICKDCGKSFMTLSGLAQHNRRLHPKIDKLPEVSEVDLQGHIQAANHGDDTPVDASVNVDDTTAVMDALSSLKDHSYINGDIFTATPVVFEDFNMSVPVDEDGKTGIDAGMLSEGVTYMDVLQEPSIAVSDPSAQENSNQRTDSCTVVKTRGKALPERECVSKLNVVHLKKHQNQGTVDNSTSKTISNVNAGQKAEVLTTLVMKQVKGTDDKTVCAPNVVGKNTAKKAVKLSITSNKSNPGKGLKYPVKILLRKV